MENNIICLGTDFSVMINEKTKVVQLQPRNQGFSSVNEKVTREADDITRGVHLGIHGVSKTGILVLHR